MEPNGPAHKLRPTPHLLPKMSPRPNIFFPPCPLSLPPSYFFFPLFGPGSLSSSGQAQPPHLSLACPLHVPASSSSLSFFFLIRSRPRDLKRGPRTGLLTSFSSSVTSSLSIIIHNHHHLKCNGYQTKRGGLKGLEATFYGRKEIEQ